MLPKPSSVNDQFVRSVAGVVRCVCVSGGPLEAFAFGAKEITRKAENRLTLGTAADNWAPGFARKGSPARFQDKKAN